MRVFLSLRGLARSACFPGLGPSVRHAPVCSSIESWLSAGPTSPREKALFLYAEMTANLPHTRKLLHSPRHPLLAYSEMACQGCWQDLLFWALKRCLLNGHLVVNTFFLPYHRNPFIVVRSLFILENKRTKAVQCLFSIRGCNDWG